MQYIFKQNDLNLRQWRCLEILKDYDTDIFYHPGKTNVVVDTLSCKITASTCGQYVGRQGITKDLFQVENLGVCFLESPYKGVIV